MNTLIKEHITEFVGRISNLTLLGISSVLLFFISVSGMYALSLGWWGNGDTVMHVDYIWQLSQGNLPSFEEGIQYKPYNDIRLHDVQGAAHHPPLYYALMTPFMAGFLEAGDWQKAVAVGRLANILIGCITILSLAWAGWVFGGSRRRLFAVIVPAIAASFPTFIKTGADVTPDMLVLLFTILVFVISYRVLRGEASRSSIIALMTLSVLGMLTKVTFLPAMVVVLAVLAVSYSLKGGNLKFSRANTGKGILLASAAAILVVVSSAWMYYGHNYVASGSLTRAGSQDWISGVRSYKSYSDVIFSEGLVAASLQLPFNRLRSLLMLFLGSLIVLAILWLAKRFRQNIFNTRMLHAKLMCIFLLVHYTALLVGQISHAEGYGQVSARYFLSGMLLSALLYAYGAAFLSRLTGSIVFLLCALNTWRLYESHTVWLAQKVSPSIYGELPMWERITTATSLNWIPGNVPYLLAVLLVASLITLTISVSKISPLSSR